MIIYYFYIFNDNNVTYYLPIPKEILNGHKIIADYYDNQLFQQLRIHYKNVRIEGYYINEGQGKDIIDRYIKSYEKGNQKELVINQIYYQLNSENDERRIVSNSHIVYYFSDKNSIRNSTILRDNENMLNDLEILDREEHIPIILIKCNIYDIYKDSLIEHGLNVVNDDNRIPFPSNGRQTEFQEKLIIFY